MVKAALERNTPSHKMCIRLIYAEIQTKISFSNAQKAEISIDSQNQ